MSIFDVLTLIGGLCLFLFGMNLMGEALERAAGNQLKSILGKLTTNKALGFLTGLAVTGVIQSSSATTVMVVGFVNSGLMSLKQAINVIMGANVGTTVTAWLLSLTGIDSGNLVVQMFKPMSFTPILALIGIIFNMFCKSDKKKDTGVILLGFATLMFGMDIMSDAVSGLEEVPAFRELFVMFTNPILGVLAGAILTAIIQSSSASVGILQAFALTGQITYGAAIPIIMGQNIGTCITAILSSFGTNKNAKRTALVHLSFNVIGTIVWLTVFSIVRAVAHPALLDAAASPFGIAIAHSVFNLLCTALLLPMSGLLEKLVCVLVPDDKKQEETVVELDERLIQAPAVALERCTAVAAEMGACAVETIYDALTLLENYDSDVAARVYEKEDKTDKYEDMLNSYLVKLSAQQIGEQESSYAAMLLKVIGDFERISDHGVNILESAEEMRNKGIVFSQSAKEELSVLSAAIHEVLDQAYHAFSEGDADSIMNVEPLEEVVDNLKELLRTRHILRLQQGECSVDAGFVWSDLLTDLERVSDHCSNIAGCVIDLRSHDMKMHENLRAIRDQDEEYRIRFDAYCKKYAV